MNKFIPIISAALCICGIYSASAAEDLPAFPGAEGGGKYTTGARAKSSREVYHVTNLNASGDGSFADAVSKEGRIIVFDVGGTIELNGTLTINKSNLTILGQTAPGDGITFSGGDISIADGKKNIIMRYLRIRPSDKNGGEPDGLSGRWNSNIIIDHCSLSWSVDELLTLYAGSTESSKTIGNHLTIQNTIAAESLRMSNHFKGAHGYGAIMGGTYASYYNNLLAHHDSRSPRLDRELKSTDIRNNIIYDWGQTNSAYGAEPYSYNNKTQSPSNVNWVGNYYKYGPATKSGLRYKIFEVSNPENVSPYSRFYFNDNFVYGNTAVTENNWAGVQNAAQAEQLDEPIDMDKYSINGTSAEEAYNYVLNNVGATLPKRDAVDARIIDDVKNGTGRIVNSANEVGGLIPQQEVQRTFEIPEEWKAENNMGNAKETDIVPDGEFAGYTWIEAYVNDWTAEQSLPTNPHITVTSPAISSLNSNINGIDVDNGNWTVINEDSSIYYSAKADAAGGYPITHMELYDKNTLLETYNTDKIQDDIYLDAGVHYLTCRAYNSKGESTQSVTSIVYVTPSESNSDFYSAQIGSGISDIAGGSENNGTYTVYGSGTIGSASDSCGFMYKMLSGDFDISVKIQDIPKFENGQVSGIMIRESLEPKSRMAMLADGWLKYGENVRIISRSSAGSSATVSYFKDSSGKSIENDSSYNTQENAYTLPSYMRIQRSGDTLTFSVSNSGTDWTDNPRQPFSIEIKNLNKDLYVGLAVDSAQSTSVKPYYAIAEFDNMQLKGTEIPTPSPSALPSATPSVSPSATPSATPSASPSAAPSESPSAVPSASPSATPSASPTTDTTPLPSADTQYGSYIFRKDGKVLDKIENGIISVYGQTPHENGKVYAAGYDISGRLISLYQAEFSENNFEAEIEADNSTQYIKVFVWDENMTPLQACGHLTR